MAKEMSQVRHLFACDVTGVAYVNQFAYDVPIRTVYTRVYDKYGTHFQLLHYCNKVTAVSIGERDADKPPTCKHCTKGEIQPFWTGSDVYTNDFILL